MHATLCEKHDEKLDHAMQNALALATCSKQPTKTSRILQNVSGAFLPGKITLLVGPPGGGKSMLMKALCGAAPVATTGSITFNGHALDEFNVVRTARYVSQHNLHNPALTVRETLMFSAMCQGPGYNPGVTASLPLMCALVVCSELESETNGRETRNCRTTKCDGGQVLSSSTLHNHSCVLQRVCTLTVVL